VTEPLRVTVLGAGNWGTTLAQLVARNGHAATLWSWDAKQCDEIDREHTNERFLPGVALDPAIRAVHDLGQAIDRSDLILILLPSQVLRQVCQDFGEVARPEHRVVHGIKGLEEGTHRRMSQVLMEETCIRQLGVLAGPNIAAELAHGKVAGTIIATRFPAITELVQRALASAQLRVFESTDVRGVELCGALKNVVAIAAGMVDQLGLGENAKAFMITRGLSELMRLVSAMGGEPATTMGLAGIGDLMATCASTLSRNHRLGVELARGVPLRDALASIGMVAEGVHASRSARALAQQHHVIMPLFEHIDRVLHEGLSVTDALRALMELPTGHDIPSVLRSETAVRRSSTP
jgi:glycerol-3-phosphate dehydrogenase (NAD(P)+)